MSNLQYKRGEGCISIKIYNIRGSMPQSKPLCRTLGLTRTPLSDRYGWVTPIVTAKSFVRVSEGTLYSDRGANMNVLI